MAGSNEVVIIAGCRTPIGKFQGSLSDMTAPQIGAVVVREAVKRANLKPEQVDECIMGDVVTAGLGQNPARQAALFGGLAPAVGAMTINKVCGSGLKAVALAAQGIETGNSSIVVAGGMESMSQAPFSIRGRDGFTLAPGGKLEDSLMVALLDTYCGLYMANTAEFYGEQQGITRQAQDEFALRSQQKADDAYKAGRIQEELTPVPLRNW